MRKMFVLLCIVFFAGHGLSAQGILFEQGSWDEALAKAKTENKLLFVDVCTSWCGSCKRMARDVFTREKVGTYFNANFISYKLDAEQGAGQKIKERYGVEAYPTFLFLDGDGKLVYKVVGYRDVKAFLAEAEKVYIYAKYGGWERVRENYTSGGGGTDFWRDCYERATADEVQDVLRKYLLSMPDKELLKAENGSLVQSAEYNPELYTRITKGLLNLQEVNDMEYRVVYVYPLHDKIGELLYEAIGQGDERMFSELMALKSDLARLPGAKYFDINVIRGESFMNASEDFLRLCFYQKSMSNDEAFRALMVVYMDKLLESVPLKKIQEERQEREKVKPMSKSDSLLLSIMPDHFKKRMSDPNAKKQEALWEYRMMANSIVDWTNYYWQVAPSGKETRERCLKWLNYACDMNPANPEAPVNAAALFVHLNDKKDAIRHVEEAITLQRKLGYDDIRQVRRLELTLRNAKEGKL